MVPQVIGIQVAFHQQAGIYGDGKKKNINSPVRWVARTQLYTQLGITISGYLRVYQNSSSLPMVITINISIHQWHIPAIKIHQEKPSRKIPSTLNLELILEYIIYQLL